MGELLLEPPSPDLRAVASGPCPAVAEPGLEVGRVLVEVGDRSASRALVCCSGLHGNEPAGVLALRRLRRSLDGDPTGVVGWFLGLSGNRRALRERCRFVRDDLNRSWTPSRLDRVRASGGLGLEAEDLELFELDREMHEILAARDGLQTRFLDLHTTSGAGPAWAVFDDTLRNREFALGLPVPVVLGLEEQIAGTLTFHLTGLGCIAIGVESGQHDDPRSVDRAEAILWLALESSGVLVKGVRPEVEAARDLLERENRLRLLPEVVEICYRHGISAEDRFRMADGYANFQPVTEGELLGSSRTGDVRSPSDGLILMPLYQPQGDDGFFLIRPVDLVWLRISAAVRRLRFEHLVHWLPGVRRHPDLAGAFLVDRRTARWLALELFHLLGFRRISEDGWISTFVRRID